MAGYVASAQALAYALGSDLVRAHAIAPWDGRITALLAQQKAGADATATERAQADRLARKALLRDPTAVAAVFTLGLDAQVRGDTTGARHLFAYSQMLSRRDFATQIWAVEDAVARGDIADVLRHYDIALRTSRNAPDLLYPILGSAIADPPVRAALVRTLAGRPVWGEAFVNYVAGNGSDSRATSALFLELQQAGLPVAAEANAVAISGLILGNHWNEAWAHYVAIRPGANRRQSRDPHFRVAVAVPSAFDWNPVNEAGIVTSMQRGDRDGLFDFAAPAGIGGTMLRQVQLLPPGEYRLEGHSIGIDQPDETRPYWTLMCHDERELGRVEVSASITANGRFAGRFTVPVGCPVQTLALVARPSDSLSGLSGQIDVVQLYPVRR